MQVRETARNVIRYHTEGRACIRRSAGRYSSWTCQKFTLFSGHYLRHRSTLDIVVLGYIGIFYHKENSPEVFTFLQGNPVYIYRVLQEEWTKLRQSVPYVKIFRYNKYLFSKLNGYWDNGQWKVPSSLGFHALYLTAESVVAVESLNVVSYYADSAHASRTLHMYFLQGNVSAEQACVVYRAWNPKDNYDMSSSVFVVHFNGFMSLIC
jgi:hypothetical protein